MEKPPKHEEARCPYCKQEIVVNAEGKLVSHNNPDKFKIPDDLTIYKPEKCRGSGCKKKQVKSNETTWITRSEVRDIELFLSLLVEKGTIPLTERHFYKELSLVHMKEMDKMNDLHEKLVKRFHIMGNAPISCQYWNGSTCDKERIEKINEDIENMNEIADLSDKEIITQDEIPFKKCKRWYTIDNEGNLIPDTTNVNLFLKLRKQTKETINQIINELKEINPMQILFSPIELFGKCSCGNAHCDCPICPGDFWKPCYLFARAIFYGTMKQEGEF